MLDVPFSTDRMTYFDFMTQLLYRGAVMMEVFDRRPLGVHETRNFIVMSIIVYLCRLKSVIRHNMDTVEPIGHTSSHIICRLYPFRRNYARYGSFRV